MRLLSESRRNVCVVGDEDQSIYSWRGADMRNILEFTKDFPDATVIRLEQNYRSTKNILEAASRVVAHNRERLGKWLWTSKPRPAPGWAFTKPRTASRKRCSWPTRSSAFSPASPRRMAVLYRTNAQSRQFEEALRRYGRPYHVVGGFSFYQRAEIKDVLAYLKAILSPQDSVSLLRIINTPARGIGRATIEQTRGLGDGAAPGTLEALVALPEEGKLGPRAQAALRASAADEELREQSEGRGRGVIRLVLERTGYLKMLEADETPESESRRENLEELVNAAAEAAERGERLAEFLDHAALVSEADTLDERAQSLPADAAQRQGPGVSGGLHRRTGGRSVPARALAGFSPALEEERRLFYVGMTRARQRLILTWARMRRRWASGLPGASKPSRFLSEVPPALTEDLGGARGASSWTSRRSAGRCARRSPQPLHGQDLQLGGSDPAVLRLPARRLAARSSAAPPPPKPLPSRPPARPARDRRLRHRASPLGRGARWCVAKARANMPKSRLVSLVTV
jgi:DNA helicase-2/ATP-dependent DNA helicase PcrA